MPTSTLVQEARVREVPFANNLLVNPGFEIWQRGAGPFSPTPGTREFTADEWYFSVGGTGSGSVSQEVTEKYTGTSSLKAVVTYVSNPIGVLQGFEAYKSLEGSYVTASIWAKSSVAGYPLLTVRDYDGITEGGVNGTHSGSGEWELLTAYKQLRTGLTPYSVVVAHSYGAWVQVMLHATGTYYIDGAVAVAGYFPEGLMYRPPNPAQDMLRCERFYQKNDSGASWASLPMFTGITTSGVFNYVSVPFSTVMASVPTVTVSNYAVSSFGATSTVWCNGDRGFWVGRQATATNNRGYFGDTWTAEIT